MRTLFFYDDFKGAPDKNLNSYEKYIENHEKRSTFQRFYKKNLKKYKL